MLKTQATTLLLRSLCFAGAAAAVTACGGGGTSGSALPPPGGVGATALTTTTAATPGLAQSTSGSAYAPSSIAISFPATPAAGHVLVVALANNGSSTGAANRYTAPSGWSLADANTSHVYHTYEVFTHVVSSGESNKYVFTPAYAQREHIWMAADVSNVSGVDKHGNSYVSASTTFAPPSLSASQTNDFALAFNMPSTSGATWSNPSGWSSRIGPIAMWSAETLSQNLSTTSASERATLSSASTGFAGMVLLSPNAGATTTSSSSPAPTSTPSSTTTAAPSGSTPSVSQWKNGSAYAPSSVTVSFPSSPAAGHLLVVALWNNGQSTGAANTYTAPAGWTLVNQNTSHAYATYQLFSHVVAAGEPNSYVFKPLSAQREHVWIALDSNAASVDKTANNVVSSSTAFTTPSVTPAVSNELALALNLPQTSNVTWTNASGWSVGNGPTSTWDGEALDRAESSTTPVSASSTLSAASSGFAAMLLLSPARSSTSTTPAPVSTPTNAPTTAPTTAPTSSPVSSGVATYHGCPLYAANDWFTTNLVNGGSSYVPNTVDPNSANIIRNLSTALGNVNFAGDSPSNLEGANVVNSTNLYATPAIQNIVYGFANDPYNDDPSPYHIKINSGTFMQEGTAYCKQGGQDCHVTVLDTDKCVVYETYRSGGPSWNASTGTFTAEGGGVENLNHAYQIERIAVSAADLPMMGTTDFGEDLSYQKSSCQPNCAIPHTVAVLLPQPSVGVGGYVTPAAYGITCTSYCTNKLPYGARLRLKSTYSCPSPTSYPQANLLCNQAKQYGWIFNDSVGVNGSGGIRLGLSSNASDPWNSGDYNDFLNNVHLSDFDVMTLGTIH